MLLGIAIFLLWQYGWGLYGLLAQADAMNNQFSALARTEHMWFMVWQNLRVVQAYFLLGMAAALVIRPLWLMWQRRARWRAWYCGVVRAMVLTFGVHFFCVLRLSQNRPYFLAETTFGATYQRLLAHLPHDVGWLIFNALPIPYLMFALWRLAVDMRERPRARRVLAIIAVVWLGSLGWSCRNQFWALFPKKTRDVSQAWNVIVIGSDSLRGDRLGYAGYRPTRRDGSAADGVSPTIDALAAESQVFRRCFTPIASTLESNTSFNSSLYPHSHGLRHMYPDAKQVAATKEKIQPLAEVLRREGYDTVAMGDWCAGFYHLMPLGYEDISVSSFDNFKIYMVQAVIMAHFTIPLYFDHSLGYMMFPEIESFAQFVTPEVVTRRVENRIAQQAVSQRPFFWHVFYSCNHLPYRSREPYSRMFIDPAYQGRHRHSVDFDINEFISGTKLEDKWESMSPADAQQIQGLYDGCTRQFDDCVARILRALREHQLDRRTVIVISADHGDDLYEPGATMGHGLSFNGGDQTNHIPWLFYIPGRVGGQWQEIVRSIDIAPTLLDFLKVPVPSQWEGRSVMPWIEGKQPARSRPFYGETGFPFIQFRVEGVERPHLPPMDHMTRIDPSFDYQFVLKPEYENKVIEAKERVLRSEKWKLIATPTATGARFYRLYDLTHDAHCERNVWEQHPAVAAALRRALDRWMDEGVESSLEEIFPQGEP